MVRGRLLLVASDRRFRDRLQLVFISRDWEVVMAATESEGIGLLNEYDPSWVVVDVRLPDGNGEALFGHLEMRRARTRVVLLEPPPGEGAPQSSRADFVVPPTAQPEEIYRLCIGTTVAASQPV